MRVAILGAGNVGGALGKGWSRKGHAIHYGVPDPQERKKGYGDARTTTLDDLDLKPNRVFGYLFDFGDEWFHQVQVERIEQAIPTVTYPRVIKRVGKSPPQYADE